MTCRPVAGQRNYTRAVARQTVPQTDRNANITLQERNGVFYAVRAEMLEARQISESVSQRTVAVQAFLAVAIRSLWLRHGDSSGNQRKGNVRRGLVGSYFSLDFGP
jgi:hypothetical protein